jgi:hypothetical protein
MERRDALVEARSRVRGSGFFSQVEASLDGMDDPAAQLGALVGLILSRVESGASCLERLSAPVSVLRSSKSVVGNEPRGSSTSWPT